MKAFLFFSLLICVSFCANLKFDVTCVAGPNACGSGGKYTLTQTAPTAQAPVANQNIVCVVGDTITFNFPTAEPRHPFDIEKNGATFPGAPGSLPMSTAGSFDFPCDNNLLTNGPANYICIFHPSMTGTITAVTANQPTPPPTNGTVGPVIPTTTTATLDLTGYPQQIDLGKGMTFFWKPVTTTDTFLDFAIQAPTLGWVGIGFSRNDNFQMKGSDAFIGFVTPSAAPSTFLSGYVLTSKTIDGILSTPSDAGTFTFESASASQFNGLTTIAIRRRLGLGLNPILPTASGQMNAMIIASYCSDTTGVNYKHDVRIDYGRYVNLATGQYEIAYRYAIPIRVAHGVLMGTAYAILFPLGLMVARYGKSPSGTWFKIHFFLQNYAFLVMLVGVIIGYTLPELQFASFTYHAGLGTAIFIFTIIQVIMGYARPHKEAGEPLSMGRKIFEFIHHWLGRSILIMAIAQIAAGILELGVAPFAYGIWVPFVGTFFIVSIILEVRERLKPKEEGGGLGYKLMI